jgi:hypothetical protein
VSTEEAEMLLQHLAELDVSISVQGEELKLAGPEASIDDDLKAEVCAHKAEIVAYLAGEAAETETRKGEGSHAKRRPGKDEHAPHGHRRSWWSELVGVPDE